MSDDFKCTILVTGFGPFSTHVVNASWEAVKELQELWTNSVEFADVKLVAEEIPVSYDYVANHVPRLWKKYNPAVNSSYIQLEVRNVSIHTCYISFVLDCSTRGCITSSRFFNDRASCLQ